MQYAWQQPFGTEDIRISRPELPDNMGDFREFLYCMSVRITKYDSRYHVDRPLHENSLYVVVWLVLSVMEPGADSAEPYEASNDKVGLFHRIRLVGK
jgi:hypothetical protein